MIPAIFTARPGEFIAELAALKTNNDAYAVFKDFVKDCYWLNGMMLPNVNFGHSLNKLLVESCLAGFLFTKDVTDIEGPISYFKVWWMFDADPNMTAAETNTMLSRMPSRDIYDALLDFRNADEAVYDMLNEGEHPYSFKRSEYIKLKKRMVKRLAAGPITFGDLLRLFSHKGTF